MNMHMYLGSASFRRPVRRLVHSEILEKWLTNIRYYIFSDNEEILINVDQGPTQLCIYLYISRLIPPSRIYWC
jgi:hypothetical protein